MGDMFRCAGCAHMARGQAAGCIALQCWRHAGSSRSPSAVMAGHACMLEAHATTRRGVAWRLHIGHVLGDCLFLGHGGVARMMQGCTQVEQVGHDFYLFRDKDSNTVRSVRGACLLGVRHAMVPVLARYGRVCPDGYPLHARCVCCTSARTAASA